MAVKAGTQQARNRTSLSPIVIIVCLGYDACCIYIAVCASRLIATRNFLR